MPPPTWRVLPHGPLETLAENLWRVQGDVPGLSIKRNMVIARRRDGGLVIHNAIAMREEAQVQLEALGTPTWLLVPSGMHRLDAPAYRSRYPLLRVLTPAGSRKKIEKVVSVDGDYGDFIGDDLVQLEALAGVANLEGLMRVRSADGETVILSDAVMNMERRTDLLGWLFTTLLGSAPGPRVSRLARLALVKNQGELRAQLERLADNPNLVRLIVAHDKVAHGPAASQALRQAATYLRKHHPSA